MAASGGELGNMRSGEPIPPMEDAEKVNILMVDDQPSKLLSYEVILEELGENLIKATSANEALEHLLRKDIAIVLPDVSIPDIEGLHLGGAPQRRRSRQRLPPGSSGLHHCPGDPRAVARQSQHLRRTASQAPATGAAQPAAGAARRRTHART